MGTSIHPRAKSRMHVLLLPWPFQNTQPLPTAPSPNNAGTTVQRLGDDCAFCGMDPTTLAQVSVTSQLDESILVLPQALQGVGSSFLLVGWRVVELYRLVGCMETSMGPGQVEKRESE